MDALFDQLVQQGLLPAEEEEVEALQIDDRFNNIAAVLSSCTSVEQKKAFWDDLAHRIVTEMAAKQNELRSMISPIMECLGNEGEDDGVKWTCMSYMSFLLQFSEGGDLSSQEIDQLIPLILTAGVKQQNDRLLKEATNCLAQLVLFKYHLLGSQKKLVASHILLNWGKETFEEVAQLVRISQLQGSNFLQQMETIRTKNSLPSFIALLGLVDGLENEEVIREVMNIFANLDRSSFQRGWDVMEENCGVYHVRLLENFLLGSLGDIFSQNVSSKLIAYNCFRRIEKGSWQELKSQLRSNLQKGNVVLLSGTLKTIEKFADECLVQGSFYMKDLVSDFFDNVFEIVTNGRNNEAIKTLESIMLCQPKCIMNEGSREMLRETLVKSLPNMEKSMAEEASRVILPRLTACHRTTGGKFPPGSSFVPKGRY